MLELIIYDNHNRARAEDPPCPKNDIRLELHGSHKEVAVVRLTRPAKRNAVNDALVASLHGAVVGASLELASACHIRVADESTFHALPDGSRGIFVGGGLKHREALANALHDGTLPFTLQPTS